MYEHIKVSYSFFKIMLVGIDYVGTILMTMGLNEIIFTHRE